MAEEAADSSRPHIDYPCEWSYTVIGTDGDSLEQALIVALVVEKMQMRRSHVSSGGRYTSFHIAVRVEDESHRNEIFGRLQGLAGVKVVL